MNLLLATPTMYKMVSAGYAKTVAAIGMVCAKHSIPWSMEQVDTAFIVDARNKLVELFLARPERTHILMVDSDSELGFQPIEKLLTCGFPFASIPFCQRQIDLRALWAAGANPLMLFDNALASSLTWCVDLEETNERIENGWAYARRTGFGCVLLARTVFDELAKPRTMSRTTELGVATWQESITEGWFDRMTDPNPPHDFLSEDMAFCERVKNIAKPRLCLDQLTLHNGTFSFGARLIDDRRYFQKLETP